MCCFSQIHRVVCSYLFLFPQPQVGASLPSGGIPGLSGDTPISSQDHEKVSVDHFSATFWACLCTLNTDCSGSLNQSCKTFQSHFLARTKHFVSGNTLYNLKLHDLMIIMEYTSQKLNSCMISKITSI